MDSRDLVISMMLHVKGAKSTKADFVDALIAPLATLEGCSRTMNLDGVTVPAASMVQLV